MLHATRALQSRHPDAKRKRYTVDEDRALKHDRIGKQDFLCDLLHVFGLERGRIGGDIAHSERNAEVVESAFEFRAYFSNVASLSVVDGLRHRRRPNQ